jgi:Ca-activated chloride channel family protein
MYRLEHSEYIYALLLIPVLTGIYLFMNHRKRKLLKEFGEASLVKQLMPDVSVAGRHWKFILSMLAFALLTAGIINPQVGTRLEETKREGVDIIIALDVSNSMNAEDIRPNRLERAKQAIYRMIENLQEDRVGIIVFAGKAYIQLPLTSDFGAAKLFLSNIGTDMIPTQGTAIGEAIELAEKSFSTEDKKHKALIIITDGENHEGDLSAIASAAAEKGIIIHSIGMGSAEGTPIPVYAGNTIAGFKKDNQGNTVMTRLDETTLMEIAQTGKGMYVRASNSDDGLKTILAEIDKMEKKKFGSKAYAGYIDRFQYFLAAAFLCMLIEMLVSERKSPWLKKINLFGEEKK